MTFYDSSLDKCGEYFIRTVSSGSFSYKAISAVSGITIAGTTNSLTLTASSGAPFVVFEIIHGTITE